VRVELVRSRLLGPSGDRRGRLRTVPLAPRTSSAMFAILTIFSRPAPTAFSATPEGCHVLLCQAPGIAGSISSEAWAIHSALKSKSDRPGCHSLRPLSRRLTMGGGAVGLQAEKEGTPGVLARQRSRPHQRGGWFRSLDVSSFIDQEGTYILDGLKESMRQDAVDQECCCLWFKGQVDVCARFAESVDPGRSLDSGKPLLDIGPWA